MADNTSQKASKSAEKNKYPNAINRTTSESLRVGDSDKVICHPTTLSSGTTNAKKKTSFQITSVTVGSRISNDGGDDSADDLDESHTDDISRVTDIENETPSYSEDTFSKDDVFFNTSAALGSAPVIPTSSQYGLAIVPNENCVNPSATCANNISGNELHVSVADNVINLVGVKHNENEMRDLHSHTGRNERFKVVKIESTEPFKRGRWMCMDYLDHSMVQQQQSQSNVANNPAKENNDVQNLNIPQAATDSGISVSDVPPPVNTVDDQVPSNLDKGTQDHQQYTMNPNAGQTAPGGYPSVSPGQTMQSQPQSQVIQQLTQSVSLNTPMPQNMLNTNQHQSLQAQQLQQVMANSGMPVQQQPVQMTQQPPQQMQSQPIQMQPHVQQQQSAPQQVPVSQQMPPQQQQMQMQQPQSMPQMPPQQHIPQQQMHNIPIPNQQMQVPQQVMQQIPQQPIPPQMQPQPQTYPQQPPQQPMQQHIQQPIHQMAPPLQPPMTQNQPSPQAYQQTTMQQCPPGISPQQMMAVPQHQLPPQPQYTYTPQGIPMMTPQGQQQNQMMTSQGQQGQMMTSQGQQGQMMTGQGQQGQMMTSQGQIITMPPQVHQTSVPVQQTYSVTSIPPQQQSQPQQQQQSQPPPQQQPQPQPQTQQQPQQQMSIGQSASMHHVPNASVATSIAGYAPVATGQSAPTVVSQPNQSSTVAATGSSQTTPTVMQQPCYMMQQGTGQQQMYSSMPSSVVEAITSDAHMMEQVVQTAALLGSLAEVTSAPEDAPPTGEETESASGTSAVAIDNKIEQAMDLVKSHLMFAVREEVEVLKEKIAELMDRINHLEVENTILKANASQETLAQLSNLPAPPSSNNAP